MKKLYIALSALILSIAFTLINNPPTFIGLSGERTAYVGSASSQAGIVDYSAIAAVNRIKGESCRVSAKNFSLDSVIKNFGAEIIFIERVGGTVSYYMYAPSLKTSATVKGCLVNLHIAVTNDYVTLGTPIIYGSY